MTSHVSDVVLLLCISWHYTC